MQVNFATLRGSFRFRLRTLFVSATIAALPLGWLGYHLNWIRQRHQTLAWFDNEAIRSFASPPLESFTRGMPRPAQFSPTLTLLGERSEVVLMFGPTESKKESEAGRQEFAQRFAQLKSLYPEAYVIEMK